MAQKALDMDCITISANKKIRIGLDVEVIMLKPDRSHEPTVVHYSRKNWEKLTKLMPEITQAINEERTQKWIIQSGAKYVEVKRTVNVGWMVAVYSINRRGETNYGFSFIFDKAEWNELVKHDEETLRKLKACNQRKLEEIQASRKITMFKVAFKGDEHIIVSPLFYTEEHALKFGLSLSFLAEDLTIELTQEEMMEECRWMYKIVLFYILAKADDLALAGPLGVHYQTKIDEVVLEPEELCLLYIYSQSRVGSGATNAKALLAGVNFYSSEDALKEAAKEIDREQTDALEWLFRDVYKELK